MGLCMIACAFLGLYWHPYAENFGCTELFGLFGIFQRGRGWGSVMRGGGAVLSEPLENRQSGGGQSTGIDILSVRGSVQGRF